MANRPGRPAGTFNRNSDFRWAIRMARRRSCGVYVFSIAAIARASPRPISRQAMREVLVARLGEEFVKGRR